MLSNQTTHFLKHQFKFYVRIKASYNIQNYRKESCEVLFGANYTSTSLHEKDKYNKGDTKLKY